MALSIFRGADGFRPRPQSNCRVIDTKVERPLALRAGDHLRLAGELPARVEAVILPPMLSASDAAHLQTHSGGRACSIIECAPSNLRLRGAIPVFVMLHRIRMTFCATISN